MFIPHSNNGNAIVGVPSLPEMENLGGISEVWYDAHRPNLLNLLLLPALQRLGQQSRWMLWLTPDHKLDKLWLKRSGIPLDKSIEVSLLSQSESVQAMILALESGNYSVITAWFDHPLTSEQEASLDYVAKKTGTVVFILRKNTPAQFSPRQENTQKIPSLAFH